MYPNGSGQPKATRCMVHLKLRAQPFYWVVGLMKRYRVHNVVQYHLGIPVLLCSTTDFAEARFICPKYFSDPRNDGELGQ